ncbi:MAG: hypothetical protein QM703_02935 [Gemmatales bacterium]
MKLLNTTILWSLTLSSIILAATTYAQPPGGGQGGPGGDMMRGPGGPGMMHRLARFSKTLTRTMMAGSTLKSVQPLGKPSRNNNPNGAASAVVVAQAVAASALPA